MLIERLRNHFANCAPAFAAIEAASVMFLHGFWAARASFNGFADPGFINTSADANDHENDLQQVRMIVKNDSQLEEFFYRARFGWRNQSGLGNVGT